MSDGVLFYQAFEYKKLSLPVFGLLWDIYITTLREAKCLNFSHIPPKAHALQDELGFEALMLCTRQASNDLIKQVSK